MLKWTVIQALVAYKRSEAAADARQRAEWLNHWCCVLLRRLQIPITVHGSPPNSGLVVSNHLSYLDILVFSATTPSVFVSKAEVRNWPVFGMLATMAGTVYVDRRRRSDTRNANEGIRRALGEGLPVVMFPEGTSSDGTEVLPFYPSLFEPAVEGGVPITAAHVGYRIECGSVGQDIAYWGEMTFFPHLIKLLMKDGIEAEVRFAPQSRVFPDRKEAALEMQQEVVQLKVGVGANGELQRRWLT